MELRPVRLSDPEVEPLLAGLAAEYEALYGPNDELSTAGAEEFEPPSGVFLVLLGEGRTLAGGGIRRLSAHTCEVKRVWTAPDHRRHGFASAVLDGLHQAARALGYRKVWAETGPAQPDAVALYRRCGYEEIAPYGPYERAIAFERDLGDVPASGASNRRETVGFLLPEEWEDAVRPR